MTATRAGRVPTDRVPTDRVPTDRVSPRRPAGTGDPLAAPTRARTSANAAGRTPGTAAVTGRQRARLPESRRASTPFSAPPASATARTATTRTATTRTAPTRTATTRTATRPAIAQTAAPRTAAPRSDTRATATGNAAPRSAVAQTAAPRTAAPRTAAPRSDTRTAAPRTATRPAVAQTAAARSDTRATAPRTVAARSDTRAAARAPARVDPSRPTMPAGPTATRPAPTRRTARAGNATRPNPTRRTTPARPLPVGTTATPPARRAGSDRAMPSRSGPAGAYATAAQPQPRPRPQPQPEVRPERRPPLRVVGPPDPDARARRRRRLVVGALVGLACAGLFAIVGVRVLLAQGQGPVDVLESEVTAAQAENQRLRLDVARLEAPSRIVDEARSRLGMAPPAVVVYLSPVSQASPPPAG